MQWLELASARTLSLLGKRALITLISLGAACLLAIGAGLLYLGLRQQTTLPEDLLPAAHTIAVVTHAEDDLRAAAARLSSVIANAPQVGEGEAAALIALENGGVEWVTFTPSATPDAAFDVLASEDARRLLQADLPSLRSDAHYRRLAAGRTREDDWLYVRADPVHAVLPSGVTSVAITREDGVATLLLLPTAEHPLESAERDIVTPFPAPFLVLSVADAPAALRIAKETMREDARIVAMARLRRWVSDHLGSSMRMDRDILPLLQGRATVQLARSGTGAIAVLLTGSLPEGSAAGPLLQQMEEQFSAGLPNIALLQRDLEDGFAINDLRIDDAVLTRNDDTVQGWRVRTLTHLDRGLTLVTAHRGNNFIVSNDAEAVTSLTRDRGELPAVFLSTTDAPTTAFLAGGYVQMNDVRSVLSTSFPSLVMAGVPLPWEGFARNLWTAELREGIIAVSLIGVRQEQRPASSALPTTETGHTTAKPVQ